MINETVPNSRELELFLQELTELTRKYEIGITGDPVLFCVEPDDLRNSYTRDADSHMAY